jgi:hypothetical protein
LRTDFYNELPLEGDRGLADIERATPDISLHRGLSVDRTLFKVAQLRFWHAACSINRMRYGLVPAAAGRGQQMGFFQVCAGYPICQSKTAIGGVCVQEELICKWLWQRDQQLNHANDST